jgi:uncharacterized membrane protein
MALAGVAAQRIKAFCRAQPRQMAVLNSIQAVGVALLGVQWGLRTRGEACGRAKAEGTRGGLKWRACRGADARGKAWGVSRRETDDAGDAR